MGSVSLDPRSMENGEGRVLLDRSSRTARSSKQDPNQSTSTSQCQSEFWSSLQPTTSDDSARDGDEFAKEETDERFETLKFAFPKKVKARGRRKASASKRRHETHLPANTFKRCLSNFYNCSLKQKNVHESRRTNLSTVSNNLELMSTAWMALPEITMTTLSSRSPTYFLPFKARTEIMHPEILKPLIKYEKLLDENPVSESKYKMLPNIQSDFVRDNDAIKSDKVYYDDRTSKITFTLQDTQEPKINYTIGQELTDDLSICTTAKNVDASSPAKSQSKTSEIKQHRFNLQDDQHSRKYDSSQSPEFRNYTQKDLFSSTTMERHIQQRLQTSQCVLQTVISKPLSSLFETLQRSNMTMKTQECTKDAAKPSAFAKIEIPRNISSKRSSMEQSYPRREYHTWKTSKIENVIKYNDRRFFASDTRAMRQEPSASYKSSRFGHLAYSRSLGKNQDSRKPSCSSSSRRVFSSKSCIVIQQSIREFENLKKDLGANASIVRLRNTRSHPDRVSLQSFSCDASKSKRFTDCEKEDKPQRSKHEVEKDDDSCSQIARSRCRNESKICGKTRRKDTCQNDKRQEYESCKKNYTCPELKRQRPCSWDIERCSETRDEKARVSSRDRARQSRDSDCSQKQGRQSYKRREDCEKSDEPRAICEDKIKGKNDCESKCEKRRVKRDIDKKKRRKCTANSRKRSNSCRKRNSFRASDKSCSKVDGKRRYSQQSIFPVPRDRKSFSTLISDIVLGTNINKRFYASCNKNKKARKQGPSCEKRKKKCGTRQKDEIKKKCVKGPAKCISRKKVIDKKSICRSMQKDKDKECKSTKKSCREEYCTNRKKEFMKDEKLKEETVKAPPSPTIKDKKPVDQSMKEQIDREYKEIDECKKGFKKEKKNNKAKMVSTEHEQTGLDRIISSRKEQQKKDSEKFASTLNESLISTDAMFKWFNIRSRIINGKIPIIAKDVRLCNVMFDRSFSTAKLDYQDDFAIERTANHDNMARNCPANSDDFQGDELPNYVETEYEDEEDDVYSRATSRPVSEID